MSCILNSQCEQITRVAEDYVLKRRTKMVEDLLKEYELVKENIMSSERSCGAICRLNGGSFEIHKPFNDWAFRIGLV